MLQAHTAAGTAEVGAGAAPVISSSQKNRKKSAFARLLVLAWPVNCPTLRKPTQSARLPTY
jgi:hypothetical protein